MKGKIRMLNGMFSGFNSLIKNLNEKAIPETYSTSSAFSANHAGNTI
jgi:hypothetical protein